ncbi:response regulator [Algoriphagus aquatilis]
MEFYKISKPTKPRVLIVEDNHLIAENLSELLEMEGFETLAALRTSKDTLNFLKFDIPDLIIMDIRLKGNDDGVKLVKKINAKLALPVVYLTACCDASYLDRVSKTKYDGFVVKPYHKETLISNIQLALKKKHEKNSLPPKEGHLTLRKDGFSVVLMDSDIKYLKADGMYTLIVGKKDEYRMRNILKEVEPMMSPNKFVRIHKSYLVNLDYITAFNHKEVLLDGLTLPIKRGFTKQLAKFIQEHRRRFK